jgi:SAM-dependent methyltransferase
VFHCPACKESLSEADLAAASACPHCGLAIETVEGIPLLVRDRRAVEETIAEAKRQGRGDWYEKPQLGQWQGPYRHHVLKRKQWVEKAIEAWSARRSAPALGLDLGCGDGSNLSWLRPRFTHLYASDYNLQRLLRAAALRIDVRLFMADISNYPTRENSFDVIFFNHVLEHIPDDATALREVRRILRPNGLLILGVPNEGSAFWQLAYRLQPTMLTSSDHKHFYTAGSLAARCAAAGLTVKEVHHIGWGIPHWTLDALIRRFKLIDDGLEVIGRRLFAEQASSLYFLLSK